MRRLVELIPVRVIANRGRRPSPDTLYGPKWRELRDFVARKHQISQEDAAAIMHTVFKYITSEVIRHGERFMIPGFGTFVRRVKPGAGGQAPNMYSISVQRHGLRALHEQFEDDEDAGPRE